MPIKPGDRLPEGTLTELIDTDLEGWSTIGPNNFNVSDQVRGKMIVIFCLPGTLTPTCSAKHVPSVMSNHGALRAKVVDEV